MTKEEVLQKVNDYCTEKQYTTATLTDGFKDKFAEHFVKSNPDGDINDEQVLGSIKFALNSAFQSACEIATVKTNEFQSKENDYKSQITELNKKIAKPVQQQQQQFELPEEVKNQLVELEKFKDEKSKKDRFDNIMALAKQGIRQKLHGSFDKYAEDYEVKLDKDDKEQADALVKKFKEIFKDSIGDITPQTPSQTQKHDTEFLESIPKIKVC